MSEVRASDIRVFVSFFPLPVGGATLCCLQQYVLLRHEKAPLGGCFFHGAEKKLRTLRCVGSSRERHPIARLFLPYDSRWREALLLATICSLCATKKHPLVGAFFIVFNNIFHANKKATGFVAFLLFIAYTVRPFLTFLPFKRNGNVFDFFLTARLDTRRCLLFLQAF